MPVNLGAGSVGAGSYDRRRFEICALLAEPLAVSCATDGRFCRSYPAQLLLRLFASSHSSNSRFLLSNLFFHLCAPGPSNLLAFPADVLLALSDQVVEWCIAIIFVYTNPSETNVSFCWCQGFPSLREQAGISSRSLPAGRLYSWAEVRMR